MKLCPQLIFKISFNISKTLSFRDRGQTMTTGFAIAVLFLIPYFSAGRNTNPEL